MHNHCEYCKNVLLHTQQTCQSCGAANPNFGVQEPAVEQQIVSSALSETFAIYLKRRKIMFALAWIFLGAGVVLLATPVFPSALAAFIGAVQLFLLCGKIAQTHQDFNMDEEAFRQFDAELNKHADQFGSATVTENFMLLSPSLKIVLLPLSKVVWVRRKGNRLTVHTSNGRKFSAEGAGSQRLIDLLQEYLPDLRVGHTPENKRAWQHIRRQAKQKRR